MRHERLIGIAFIFYALYIVNYYILLLINPGEGFEFYLYTNNSASWIGRGAIYYTFVEHWLWFRIYNYLFIGIMIGTLTYEWKKIKKYPEIY